MTVTGDLLALERRFWLEGADFYRAHLADQVLMLFPGAGLMRRDETIESIERAPRWRDVEIRDEQMLQLGPDSWLLCYQATAQRDGHDAYSALVSSAYVRRGASWRLIFHQQSPNPAGSHDPDR